MDWSHADTPRAGDCPIPSIHCRSHVTADTQCRRDDPITRCVSSERIFFAVFEGSNPETFFHDFARGFARDNPSSLRSFRASRHGLLNYSNNVWMNKHRPSSENISIHKRQAKSKFSPARKNAPIANAHIIYYSFYPKDPQPNPTFEA